MSPSIMELTSWMCHNDGAMSLIYKAPESGSFFNFKKDYKAEKLFLRQKNEAFL